MIKFGSNISYAGLLAIVKLNILHEKAFFTIRLNNETEKLLKILVDLSFVLNYKVNNNLTGDVIVYVNSDQFKNSIQKLKIYWRPSNPQIWSLKKLHEFNKHNAGTIFYLSTSKGVISSARAEDLNVGGIAIFIF